jgi:hypothetical protein
VHTCTPLALRLAEQLETEWPEDCDTNAIAAELRRLFQENENLHVENRRLIDRLEAIRVPVGVPVGSGGYLTPTAAIAKAGGEA